MRANRVNSDLMVIPEEVVYNNIFPFLRLNDFLRLRRVSKHFKRLSDDYVRNHFTHQEREINETDHTVGDFIKRDFPTSHIYINNTGPEFFEDTNIPEFVALYAARITHLRLKHFSTCLSDAEDNFFLALTNLEHLELEFTDAKQRNCLNSYKEMNGVKVYRDPTYFPVTFKNFKTLLFGEIEGSSIIDQGYGYDIMTFCENLEHLKHPLYNKMPSVCDYSEGPWGCVIDLVKKRLAANKPIKLKYYDLEHYYEEGIYYDGYLDLVKLCFDNNIKLLNVDAAVHEMVNVAFEDNYQQFAEPLISVKNVHGCLFLTELPNLEQVVINSTHECSYGYFWEGGDVPEWPKLKVIDITIDSNELPEAPDLGIEPQPTDQLLSFLFRHNERGNLRDLRIRFDKDAREGGRNGLPCPRVADIEQNCYNVTKLTLSNWLGTNKAVSKFWTGLPLLEEVVLEECRMLGDVAFVGTNREDPTFLTLANLKKFTLKGLEVMPKLTDLVFSLVFRNLKVKEFHLISLEPIKSFSIDGIRSLLTGQFNSNVEKFPFRGWSLENVSKEEFALLKAQFRASHML